MSFRRRKTKNSRRNVAIDESLAVLLRNYLSGRTDGLLFPCRNGRPPRNSNVLSVLHRILAELKRERGGMPAFRHHRVSELVMGGVSVGMVRSWIGHGSDRMIARYTHSDRTTRPNWRKCLSSTLTCFGKCRVITVVGVAQLVERRSVAPNVAGSSPVSHPTFPNVYQQSFGSTWCPQSRTENASAAPPRLPQKTVFHFFGL